MKRLVFPFIALAMTLILLLSGCSSNATIVSKRIDGNSLDVREYLKNGTNRGDISSWNAWWSTHHVYALDSVRIMTSQGQYLEPISDFWLFPDETEYLVNTYGYVASDCEDGAIKGAADLIAAGQPAYLCIGWVFIDGIWYGHAWIECGDDLIETTTTPSVVVEGRPTYYRLSLKCNLKSIQVSRDVGVPESIPGVPPDNSKELFSNLTGGSV
jgi:hypothetical protein